MKLSPAAQIVAGLMSISPAAAQPVTCAYDAMGAYVCRDAVVPEDWDRTTVYGPFTTIEEHHPDGSVETHTCVTTGPFTNCN